MLIISQMKTEKFEGSIPGRCALCEKIVYEHKPLLDKTFSGYVGKCPFCGAFNFLSRSESVVGYIKDWMYLILPSDEEVVRNNLPSDIPTRGPGGPAEEKGMPFTNILDILRRDGSNGKYR